MKESLYINIPKIIAINKDCNYFIFQGGRGIGKTYSTLKYYAAAASEKEKIIYLRRTDAQIKESCTPYANPFKAINYNEGTKYECTKEGELSIIWKDEDHSEYIGYCMSLSTFGNLKGADFSDVSIIIFDEFINLARVNPLKNEGYLLFNFLETVGRNREIEGKEPIKLIMLSNAETINDNIIMYLNIGEPIMKIAIKGNGVYIDKERELYYQLLETPKQLKERKRKTSLYKLAQNTDYYQMAIENEFINDFFGDIKQQDIREYYALCSYENVYVYQHKSRNIYYLASKKHNREHYDKNSFKEFKRKYGLIFMNGIEKNRFIYDTYDTKLKAINIFK